jgi:hypothetical protein
MYLWQNQKMKQNLFRLLFFVGISTLFFSCGNAGRKSETMQTETRRFEQRFYLTDNKSDGELTVKMTVELPKRFHNKRVLRLVRDDIVANVFGKEFVQYSNRKLLPRFASSLSEEYRNNNLPLLNSEIFEDSGFSFNDEFLLHTFSATYCEHIFNYVINVSMGETSGAIIATFLSYNLRDGSRILEEDIFTENFEPTLTEMLKRQLMTDREISEEELKATFWVENILPNSNFYITHESINYVFNLYEIASSAVGHVQVTVLFENIIEILKPNSPIEHLKKDAGRLDIPEFFND